ncbi:MAG: BatA domain-containing protein [Planctomycetota bacterium]
MGSFGPFGYSTLVGSLLGLALAPILIHLLNRMRYRRRRWAAMDFLRRARRKSRFILTLKDIILLILRVAALAALILALARLTLSRSLPGITSNAGTYRVVILDCSGSMTRPAATDPGATGRSSLTAFEAARTDALKLVEALEPSDSGAVILMKGGVLIPAQGALSNPGVMKTILETATPSDTTANIPAALAEAMRLIDSDAANYPRRDICILTDHQTSAFETTTLTPAAVDALSKSLSRPGAPYVRLIGPFARTIPGNVSLESLEPETRRVTANRNVRFNLTVVNHSLSVTEDLELTITTTDGNREFLALEPLSANGRAAVAFDVSFETTGAHTLSVSLSARGAGGYDDGFSADDRLDAAVLVQPSALALLVDGDRRAGALTGELDFIDALLSAERIVERAGRPSNAPAFDTALISDADLADHSLEPYSLVILGNISFVPSGVAERLMDYVQSGGGLLVTAGENVDADVFRALDPTQRLLPIEFADISSDADGCALTTAGGDPEFLAPFITSRQMNLNVVKVSKKINVRLRDDPSNLPLMQFSDGSISLAEKTIGRGRAAVWLTSIDAEWTDFPRRAQEYAVFFYFLSDRLARAPRHRLNAFVNSSVSLSLPFDTPRSLDSVEIDADPFVLNNEIDDISQRRDPLKMELRRSGDSLNAADSVAFVADQLTNAGLYELKLRGATSSLSERLGASRFLFSVFPDPAESNLDALDSRDARDRIATILSEKDRALSESEDALIVAINPATLSDGDELNAAVLPDNASAGLWRQLLAFAAGLFFIEQTLALIFGDYEKRLPALARLAVRRLSGGTT